MKDNRAKVYVIDTKPSDKSLFDAKIGGHKTSMTWKGYQSLILNNPGRYKLAEGQQTSPVTATIDLRVKPEGIIQEGKKVTAQMKVVDAIDYIKTLMKEKELDAAIDGEIRKSVLEAYSKQMKGI